jgi:hypothetical protein
MDDTSGLSEEVAAVLLQLRELLGVTPLSRSTAREVSA